MSFSTYIDAALVCVALKSAILRRHPQEKLVHHSDRGVQYAAGNFRNLLTLHGISCSMSRKGDPWGNACMESFFDKLKSECVGGLLFATHAEAEQELFWYIEIFSNRSRRHASLGYVSPADYEARALTTRAA